MPLQPPAPHAVTDTGDDAERVAAAIRALGPLDREALLLRLQGRSLTQVAASTRTTTAMVRVRLHRAATAVQRSAGPWPDVAPPAAPPQPSDEVLVDAELGITPVLHARLVAALAHTRPASPPRFRRLVQLSQTVLDHRAQLAAAGPVVAVVAVGLGALVGAA